MGFETGFYYPTKVNTTINNVMIWLLFSTIVAIMGGITLYYVFLKKQNKFTGFLKFAHDFFNFKVLFLEDILKISYLVLAICITLGSLGLIAVNPLSFICVLIGGNLVLRVTYEISLLLITICQNTTEINKKLKNKEK